MQYSSTCALNKQVLIFHQPFVVVLKMAVSFLLSLLTTMLHSRKHCSLLIRPNHFSSLLTVALKMQAACSFGMTVSTHQTSVTPQKTTHCVTLRTTVYRNIYNKKAAFSYPLKVCLS